MRWWACVTLALVLAHADAHAQEQAKLEQVIPQVSDVPTIDGAVTAREWTGASILPPLTEDPGSLVRDQHTRIYVGWRGTDLLLAVQYRPGGDDARIVDTSAQAFTEMKSGDHLELALSAKGAGASVLVWPPQAFVVSADQPLAEGWSAKVSRSESSWEAEVQIPLARLGIDPKSPAPLHLDAVLYRPSLGQPPAKLSIDLTLLAQGFAVRFLEGGTFVGGVWQGGRVELVNSGAEPLTLATKFTFRGGDGVIGNVDEPQFLLPADSARRIQLAQPLTTGRFNFDYAVSMGSVTAASGAFAFESGGALQVDVQPFLLWRGGVFVKAILPAPIDAQPTTQPTAVQLSARLLDAAEQKTLTTDSATGPRPGASQLFLDARSLPAGVYVVEVSASADGKVIATQKQRVTKAELPKWWKPRDFETRTEPLRP
jgi:hypothetical protein